MAATLCTIRSARWLLMVSVDPVHAYLHRVEGDQSNAEYWYRRAEKPPSPAPLKKEWDEIAGALLGERR